MGVDTENEPVYIDKYPDTCPVCQHKAEIKKLGNEVRLYPPAGPVTLNKLQIFYECPNRLCASRFIIEYSRGWNSGNQVIFYEEKVYPGILTVRGVAKEVALEFGDYAKIFTQAEKAHSYGLLEVSGIAYRKALEYLVVGFCIKENPQSEGAILKSKLGQCINNYIKDPDIKACAERSVWLGNDEAHVVRAHPNYDVEDLRQLIELTEHYISFELKKEKYKARINKPK